MIEVLYKMSFWQVVGTAAAVPMALAFLGRLSYGDGPIWSHVRARYVLLHFAGFCYCGTAILLQPDGLEIFGEAFGLAMCGLFLWTTYPTWGLGRPPEYALRRIPPSKPASRGLRAF